MDIVLQIAIILACLFYGARKGGVALGLLGGCHRPAYRIHCVIGV